MRTTRKVEMELNIVRCRNCRRNRIVSEETEREIFKYRMKGGNGLDMIDNDFPCCVEPMNIWLSIDSEEI